MLKCLPASLFAVVVCLASAAQAGPSCFTPDEAKAAHFRTMQQEFNVAALNCQSVDPNDPNPSVHDRYNQFVSRFDGTMQDNARSLKAHFARAGGNFDQWMTRVANDAGQRVGSDPQFCQRASDNLDKALTLAPHEVEGFAVGAMQHASFVTDCAEAQPATPVKHKAKKAAAKTKAKPKPKTDTDS